MSSGLNLPNQAWNVETQFCGIFREVRILQSVLVFIQGVVHLPKVPLRAGGFRGLDRMFSMRMHVREWKVSESEAQIISQILLNRFDNRVGGTTKRAFIITILKQSHGRIDWSLNVVATGDRKGEF